MTDSTPSNAGRRWWTRWQAYWFEEGDLRPLALLRMGWAIAVLLETANEALRAQRYTPMTRSGLEQFHWPLMDFVPPVDEAGFATLLLVAQIGGWMTLLGALPRVGAGLAVFAHGWLFSISLLNFRNHIYLLLLIGMILMVAPSDRRWSVNALIRRAWSGVRGPTTGPLWASRLAKWQAFLIYLFAVLHKADGRFLDGWALQIEMGKHLPKSIFGGWVAAEGWLSFLGPPIEAGLGSEVAMSTFAFMVLLGEAFICFGLVIPWLRRHAAIAGVLMHGGIFLTMNVVTFGVMMVATYPLFLAERQR